MSVGRRTDRRGARLGAWLRHMWWSLHSCIHSFRVCFVSPTCQAPCSTGDRQPYEHPQAVTTKHPRLKENICVPSVLAAGSPGDGGVRPASPGAPPWGSSHGRPCVCVSLSSFSLLVEDTGCLGLGPTEVTFNWITSLATLPANTVTFRGAED